MGADYIRKIKVYKAPGRSEPQYLLLVEMADSKDVQYGAKNPWGWHVLAHGDQCRTMQAVCEKAAYMESAILQWRPETKSPEEFIALARSKIISSAIEVKSDEEIPELAGNAWIGNFPDKGLDTLMIRALGAVPCIEIKENGSNGLKTLEMNCAIPTVDNMIRLLDFKASYQRWIRHDAERRAKESGQSKKFYEVSSIPPVWGDSSMEYAIGEALAGRELGFAFAKTLAQLKEHFNCKAA